MSLLSMGWAGLGLSMHREHMSVGYRSGQTQGLLSSVCSAWVTGGGMRPELSYRSIMGGDGGSQVDGGSGGGGQQSQEDFLTQ